MNKNAGILFIENEENIRAVLAFCLKREDYSVYKAGNEQKTKSKPYASFYNFESTSEGLPDTGGTQLPSEPKQITPKMAGIMLTRYPSMSNALWGLSKCANVFFLKPVHFELLLRKSKELLERDFTLNCRNVLKNLKGLEGSFQKNSGSMARGLSRGEGKRGFCRFCAEAGIEKHGVEFVRAG
jgi:DNA-binding NtrC family response regulator